MTPNLGLSGKLLSSLMEERKEGRLYITIHNPVKTRQWTMVSSNLKILNLNDLLITI